MYEIFALGFRESKIVKKRESKRNSFSLCCSKIAQNKKNLTTIFTILEFLGNQTQRFQLQRRKIPSSESPVSPKHKNTSKPPKKPVIKSKFHEELEAKTKTEKRETAENRNNRTFSFGQKLSVGSKSKSIEHQNPQNQNAENPELRTPKIHSRVVEEQSPVAKEEE